MRLLTIAGTRPEAIKLAPLALAAARRPAIVHRLVATGQHGALFHQTLAGFGVAADHDLALLVPGQSVDDLAESVSAATAVEIDRVRPDLLIVQGDTTSAWAAAMTGDAAGVPVAHVEAGLRSGDPLLPWPEERNRIDIDALATLLFAPTPRAVDHLAGEPAVRGHVVLTGNTGIDALLATRDRLDPPPAGNGRRLILVTAHRRENIGRGIAGVCTAITRLAMREDVSVVLPVHPNPAVQAQVVAALSAVPRVTLLPALDYPEMVRLMAGAFLILSDSGGIQEEAPALGVPLLVLRDNSERPESIGCGGARLVGTDPAAIVLAATRLLDDPAAYAAMARPAFPYGTGDAADRILDAIVAWHDGRLPQSRRSGSTLAFPAPLPQGEPAKGRV